MGEWGGGLHILIRDRAVNIIVSAFFCLFQNLIKRYMYILKVFYRYNIDIYIEIYLYLNTYINIDFIGISI